MGEWSRGKSVLAGAAGWLVAWTVTDAALRAAGPLGETSLWLELLLSLAPLLILIVVVRVLLHWGAGSSLWLGVAATQLVLTFAVLGLLVVPLGASDPEVLFANGVYPVGLLLAVSAVAFVASRRNLGAKLAGIGTRRRAELKEEQPFDQL